MLVGQSLRFEAARSPIVIRCGARDWVYVCPEGGRVLGRARQLNSTSKGSRSWPLAHACFAGSVGVIVPKTGSSWCSWPSVRWHCSSRSRVRSVDRSR